MEAAGLALAVLPIVIKALKCYMDGKNLLVKYRNKNAVINSLIQDLEFFRFSIDRQVTSVLANAGALAISETDLRSGQGAIFVKDSPQNRAVEIYLGERAYRIFTTQLKVCQESLAEIVSELGGLTVRTRSTERRDDIDFLQQLIHDSQLSPIGESWEDRYKRLKFSVKSSQIEASMLKLNRATKKLKDTDLQTPQQRFSFFEPAYNSITSHQLQIMSTAFEHVRHLAGHLYSALTSSLPCFHHPEHHVRLFLDDRTEIIYAKHRMEYSFRIDLQGLKYGAVDTWHRCSIETTSDEARRDWYQSSVRSRNGAAQGVTVNEAAPPQYIHYLCPAVQDTRSRNNDTMCRFMLSYGKLHYLHHVQPNPAPSSSDVILGSAGLGAGDCITLEALIEQTQPLSFSKWNWTTKQQMILALRLACSVLQLNRTRWLAGGCRSESIFFEVVDFQSGANVRGAKTLSEAEQPYLVRSDPPDFSNETPTEQAHALLLDLGIVLMEIWTKVTFKQKCQGRDVPNSYRERHEVAGAWLTDIERSEDMAPKYFLAVRRCIDGSSRPSYNFESIVSQKRFCEDVVMRLLAVCQQWL